MNFTLLKTVFRSKVSTTEASSVPTKASSFGNFKNLVNGNSLVSAKGFSLEEELDFENFSLAPPAARQFEELLRVRFEKAGWTIRKHVNDSDFRIHELAGRQVAFSMSNENDKVSEYSGVLRHSGNPGSAMFRLEGDERFYNANMAGIMAAEPR